jgi:phenylacetate-CoA ligase
MNFMDINFLDFERTSPETIKKWQWAKVAELLKRANQVKFYKLLYRKYGIKIEQIKNFEDFKNIPLITEDDLRDNARDFLYMPLNKIWRVFATSGTTGKPKLIFREPITNESEILSVFHHLFKRAGFIPKLAAIMRPAGGLGASGPVTAKVMELLGIPCFTVSPESSLKKTVLALTEIRPDLLIISPSFASMLILNLKREGVAPGKLGVEKIISTGEALHPNERRFIEQEFNAEIINTYGAADPSVWLGSECSSHHGLHLFPYTSYIELLDRDGKISEDKGEVIVTPFSNHAMPLVRYRLGDFVEIDHEPAGCSTSLPRFRSVSRAEKPLTIELEDGAIEFEVRKALDKTILDFPEVNSFFNFIVNRPENSIEILFEADPGHLGKKSPEKTAVLIEKKFTKVLSEFSADALKEKFSIHIKIVPLGTLYREAAKLKDQIKVI